MQVLLIRTATTTGHGIALGILSRRRLNFNHVGTPISQKPDRHRPSRAMVRSGTRICDSGPSVILDNSIRV